MLAEQAPKAFGLATRRARPFFDLTSAGRVPNAPAGVPIVEAIAADGSFPLGAGYGATLAGA